MFVLLLLTYIMPPTIQLAVIFGSAILPTMFHNSTSQQWAHWNPLCKCKRQLEWKTLSVPTQQEEKSKSTRKGNYKTPQVHPLKKLCSFFFFFPCKKKTRKSPLISTNICLNSGTKSDFFFPFKSVQSMSVLDRESICCLAPLQMQCKEIAAPSAGKRRVKKWMKNRKEKLERTWQKEGAMCV